MSVIGSNFPIPQPPQLISATPNQPGNGAALKAELDAWAMRQEETRQALSRMKPPDWRAQQKAAAEQKVQQIKDQIKMLTMMAGACDPKINARQITQLAKELAAAVQEYASACGTDTPQPTVNAPSSGAAQGGATASASTASPATAPVAAAPADAASPAPADAAASAFSAQGKIGAQGATVEPKSQISAADQSFIKEVRDLAEKLKALARLQQARMQGKQQGEISASFDAISQVAKGLGDIAIQATAPSINIFA